MIYLLAYNIVVFIIFGIDKYKAIKNKYRISEKTLIIFSSLLGSVGAVLAMIVFNHKTSATGFKIKIIISIFINVFILLSIYKFMV